MDLSVYLLPCVSKPYGYIMFDQLMDYFGEILAPNQSAYRKGYDTQHVLMSAIEDSKQSLNNNEYVEWVLVDPSKAFDALPNGLMLAVLHAYGVTNPACNFISDYLTFI